MGRWWGGAHQQPGRSIMASCLAARDAKSGSNEPNFLWLTHVVITPICCLRQKEDVHTHFIGVQML